jgi:hypothetical protein
MQKPLEQFITRLYVQLYALTLFLCNASERTLLIATQFILEIVACYKTPKFCHKTFFCYSEC